MRAILSAVLSAAVASCFLIGCGGSADNDVRTAEQAGDTTAAIAVGDSQTCTLSRAGVVECDGQPVGIVDATSISVGHDHACAVRRNGAVACFGKNAHGQLGDGTTDERSAPLDVLQVGNAVGVTAGFSRTCAWTETGDAFCWGTSEYDPHRMVTEPRDVPTPTHLDGLAGVKSIALGGFHGCALLEGGAVQCWGANYFGQLGDGTNVAHDVPAAAAIRGVSAIVAGTHHTCAIAGDDVLCWGADLVGQLGDASTPGQHRATPTAMPSIRRARSIAAGGDHTCVILDGRSAPRCWGYNDVGQVSPGRPYIVRPPTIPVGIDDVTSIASGPSRTCAIRSGGAVHCWGDDGPT